MCIWYFYSVVFFFKQKTAYVMRISDWSSDVCSSDLRLEDRRQEAGEEPGPVGRARRADAAARRRLALGQGPCRQRRERARRRTDRKSDVEGKSTAARVDQVGPSSINKKKDKRYHKRVDQIVQ